MGLGNSTRPVSEIVAHFTDRQQEAFRAMFTHRYILYGGARGGGKSRWLRWALLLYLIYLYKVRGLRGVRVALFCETYPDLRDRQISKIKREFPLALGEVKETKEDGLCFFLNEDNGGGMIALRNLDDPSKYQSAEFAAIGVDELTKTIKETFDILRGSLRWPGVAHTVFIAATNPGGVGHGWVKQLWLDRIFPVELQGRADEFIFIRSLPSDNPHLDKSYWDELNSLPEDLRRAWVHGDWDVFAGQAFSMWRSDRHVIKPFDIPLWWVRLAGIDWGYAVPWGCIWMAINPDNGRRILYREAYQARLTERQQAQMIKDLTGPNEVIGIYFADPSMWAKRKLDQLVTSTADIYNDVGVVLTAADNTRILGKRKVDNVLADLPDGMPGLQVFDTCINFIRTLPALPRDKNNVEDVDTEAEDHLYDCLRYSLSNYRPPKIMRDAVMVDRTQQRRSVLYRSRIL